LPHSVYGVFTPYPCYRITLEFRQKCIIGIADTFYRQNR